MDIYFLKNTLYNEYRKYFYSIERSGIAPRSRSSEGA